MDGLRWSSTIEGVAVGEARAAEVAWEAEWIGLEQRSVRSSDGRSD